MRRDEGAREHLDGHVAAADRDASLADIDRLSAWFGGHALTIAAVRRLLRAVSGRPLVVDVGGGRGDFARRLARAARRRGQRLRIVVLDRDLEGLGLAAVVCRRYPEVSRVCADASALPFRDEGVDVAVSSLVLHHLSPEAAVSSLHAMRAAAGAGVVVNDLLRTRLSWLLVVVATQGLRATRVLPSRRSAVGTTRLRARRTPGALREGGLAAPAHPTVPDPRPLGGGDLVTMTSHHDVVVIGAGPAGAACAILLAERGLAVTHHRSRPFTPDEDLWRVPESGRRAHSRPSRGAQGDRPCRGRPPRRDADHRTRRAVARRPLPSAGRSGGHIATAPWPLSARSSTVPSPTGCARCPSISASRCASPTSSWSATGWWGSTRSTAMGAATISGRRSSSAPTAGPRSWPNVSDAGGRIVCGARPGDLHQRTVRLPRPRRDLRRSARLRDPQPGGAKTA